MSRPALLASVHEHYRTRIAAALAAAAIGPIGGAPQAGWSIHTARFQPGRGPWAEVVQQGPRSTEVLTAHFYDGDDGPEIPAGAVDTPAGPVVPVSFLDDAALPSLRRLTLSPDELTVVRYRPGSRCTLRVGGDGGIRWVKVFGGGIDARQEVDSVVRWRASQRGELGFLVAEPDHVDVAGAAEWQRDVPGEPILPGLRGAEAVRLVRSIGVALSTLSRSSLVPSLVTARIDDVARTRRGIRRLARTVPFLAEAVDARTQRLADAVTSLPSSRSVPIHGSPHAHQWLLAGESRLGLVDFDRWALGEPELDAATLLGELYFEDDLGAELNELGAAVCEGYRDGGVALDDRVLDWYLAHRLLAKVIRTTLALRPDGDERAARHLVTVDNVLGSWSGTRC